MEPYNLNEFETISPKGKIVKFRILGTEKVIDPKGRIQYVHLIENAQTLKTAKVADEKIRDLIDLRFKLRPTPKRQKRKR